MVWQPKAEFFSAATNKGIFFLLAGLCVLMVIGSQKTMADSGNGDSIACANLIYAGTKSSRCFSDQFLHALSNATTVETSRKFKPVKLSSPEIFSYPFAIMTGEDKFTLTDGERENLKRYLIRGGFLLASAGCSNKEWDEAFRVEIKAVFPDRDMDEIPMDHPIYSMAYEIDRLETKEADAPPGRPKPGRQTGGGLLPGRAERYRHHARMLLLRGQ